MDIYKCAGCDGVGRDGFIFCYNCSKICGCCGIKVGMLFCYKKKIDAGGEYFIKNMSRNLVKAGYISGFAKIIKTHFKKYEEIVDKYLMLM